MAIHFGEFVNMVFRFGFTTSGQKQIFLLTACSDPTPIARTPLLLRNYDWNYDISPASLGGDGRSRVIMTG